MAWNKKDAEVVLLLKAISKNVAFQNINNTALTSPKFSFELENKLSPITNVLEKNRAIDVGILLLSQAKTNRSLSNSIIDVGKKLKSDKSINKQLIAGLQVVINLTTFSTVLNDKVKLIGALNNPQPQIIKILDMLILQSIASIPIIGPASAGISGVTLSLAYQGIMTALTAVKDRKKADLEAMTAGAALAFGGAAVNRFGDQTQNKVFNANPSDSNAERFAAKEGGAMGKAGDLKAPGVIEFIYAVYDERQNSARDDAGKKIKRDGIANVVNNDFLSFNAPNNQGVVAANVLGNGDFGTHSCSSKNLAENIARSGEKGSANCKEFFNKISELSRNLKDFFEGVITDSVVVSFAPLVAAFRLRMNALEIEQPQLIDGIKTGVLNDETHILAAVLVGWFFKNSVSVQQMDLIKGAFPWIRDGVNLQSTASFLRDKQLRRIQAGDITKEDFNNQIFPTGIAGLAEKSADEYVDQIKTVVAGTLNDLFSKAPKPDAIEEIVALQVTCTNILSECYKRAAAGQDIEIDEKYINQLVSLGYVKTYTKSVFRLGLVSDDKKKKTTLGKDDQGQDKWTLRYPLGVGKIFSATASVKEAAMVYAFAVLVTQYVDILRLSVGLDNYTSVKQNLNKAIEVINKAANNDLYN
jgi:hypothetical protein